MSRVLDAVAYLYPLNLACSQSNDQLAATYFQSDFPLCTPLKLAYALVVQGHRTFFNHITAEMTRYAYTTPAWLIILNMSSGWFDFTEPSLVHGKHSVQCAYAIVRGSSSASIFFKPSI